MPRRADPAGRHRGDGAFPGERRLPLLHRSQLLGGCRMEIAPEVREVLRPASKLGEGVLWDAQRALVWFVDIKQHRLWHFDPATGSNAMAEAPEQIGWALPAESGLLLCGLKDGLYTFDPESQEFEKLTP